MLLKFLREENYVWSETVEAKLTIRREGGFVTTVTELYSDPFEIETHAAILLAVCTNGPCSRFFIKRKQWTYCTTRRKQQKVLYNPSSGHREQTGVSETKPPAT